VVITHFDEAEREEARMTRENGDVCYYPRSNKIWFRGVDVIGRIERLDYWDGEE
jgi:hypothetical protein